MNRTLIEPRSAARTPTAPIQSVFLHVTKACNLHCAYCYFSARKPLPDEMTVAELAAVWPDLVAIAPRKVVFTGGEPLLRADLFELLQDLRAADPEHRVVRCLNSNGRLVTPDVARGLAGLVDEVRVSLDAFAPANDALRGQGAFADAMRALQTYSDAGFEPKVLVTVTAQTFGQLEDLICMLVGAGFPRINVNGLRTIGRGKGRDDWRVDWRDIHAAVDRAWTRCFPDAPARPPPPREEVQHHCGVGRLLNIMPNGDVFPCHALAQPEFRLGALRERRLLEICAQGGLLGALSSLDFAALAQKDGAVAALTTPSVCMGHVYRETKESPAWRPLLADASGSG